MSIHSLWNTSTIIESCSKVMNKFPFVKLVFANDLEFGPITGTADSVDTLIKGSMNIFIEMGQQFRKIYSLGEKSVVVVTSEVVDLGYKAFQYLVLSNEFTKTTIATINERVPVLNEAMCMNIGGVAIVATGVIGKRYAEPEKKKTHYVLDAMVGVGLAAIMMGTYRTYQTKHVLETLFKTQMAQILSH